ncbi:hypothetical protein B0H13DRAFT_2261949 [Mycena leptocephala]|nr:hypothetical protein B0H13DRAFT_2261949 [Mycena leptocephala]
MSRWTKLPVIPDDSDGRAAQADGHIEASEVKAEEGGDGRNCGAGGRLDARTAPRGGKRILACEEEGRVRREKRGEEETDVGGASRIVLSTRQAPSVQGTPPHAFRVRSIPHESNHPAPASPARDGRGDAQQSWYGYSQAGSARIGPVRGNIPRGPVSSRCIARLRLPVASGTPSRQRPRAHSPLPLPSLSSPPPQKKEQNTPLDKTPKFTKQEKKTHNRMRSHIEQQKVALLRAQQPFVDEAFGGAFADLGECQRVQNGAGVSDSEGEDGAGVESDEEEAADGGRSSSSRIRVVGAPASA